MTVAGPGTTTERSLLVIADIGGYTDYMRTHRMSLAHAEVNTGRLLERVIDAAAGFDLVEVEGDAAFLSRPAASLPEGAAVTATLDVATAMHRAFHAERRYVARNLCPCDGCTQAENLRLKFVAHIGEVATQTIRDRRKLVGVDVILVHRLVKNRVTVPEYVLLTEDLYALSDDAASVAGVEVSQDVEGIGPTRAYVLDVESFAGPLPPPPNPSLLARLGGTLAVAGAGMPFMLGLRQRRRDRTS